MTSMFKTHTKSYEQINKKNDEVNNYCNGKIITIC